MGLSNRVLYPLITFKRYFFLTVSFLFKLFAPLPLFLLVYRVWCVNTFEGVLQFFTTAHFLFYLLYFIYPTPVCCFFYQVLGIYCSANMGQVSMG